MQNFIKLQARVFGLALHRTGHARLARWPRVFVRGTSFMNIDLAQMLDEQNEKNPRA